MLRKFVVTVAFLTLIGVATPALAQGCGPNNPNCVVPTAPPGTNNNQAASTAFVQAALPTSGTKSLIGFGAKCDGVTDDTTAIQNWAAALGSGVTLTLPVGTCIFKSPIQFGPTGASIVNWAVVGQGSSSILQYAGVSTTNNLLVFGVVGGAGTIELNQGTIANFRLTSTTHMTAGAGFAMWKTSLIRFFGIIIDGQYGSGNLWDGVLWAGSQEVKMIAGEGAAQHDNIVAFSFLPTPNNYAAGCYCGPVAVIGGKYSPPSGGTSNTGLHATAGTAFLISGGADIIGNNINVLYDTSNGTACQCSTTPGNQGLWMDTTGFIDTAVNVGLQINDGSNGNGNRIFDLKGSIASCTGSNTTCIGVQIIACNQTGANCWVMINGQVADAQGDGVRIQDAATYVSVGPAAIINHNGIGGTGFGVNCTVSTTNVSVLAVAQNFQFNTSGNFGGSCNNAYYFSSGLTFSTGLTSGAVTPVTVADTVSGNSVNLNLKNNATAANSLSNFALQTGVANSFVNFQLNASGTFAISSGSAVTPVSFGFATAPWNVTAGSLTYSLPGVNGDQAQFNGGGTGGTVALKSQNAGTVSNALTNAQESVVLSNGTNVFLTHSINGGASPSGSIAAGSGVTGGLNIGSPASAINLQTQGGFITALSIGTTGLVIVPLISSDATHTDSTVCQDTTTHALYSGSGAAGICLGTSSERFKHDIAPLPVGLKQVLAMHPVMYKLNADHGDAEHWLYGFTAERELTNLPDLIGRDAAGEPNSFDYMGVMAVVVRAIQQQQQQIDQLRGAP